MRKIFLPLMVLILISLSTSYAQTFADYVLEMRGDTAVIKDFADMSNQSSTLVNAIDLDGSAPAGRVYMLKKNGFYPLATNLTSPSDRGIVIAGEDFRRVVNNDDANSAPPVICGSTIAGAGSNTGAINWQNDLTVKNCSIIPAAPDATLGWSFFNDAAADRTIILENDYFEHTRWVMINSNNSAGNSIYFKDCYFVNMSGQPCRRNGGVYDNVNNGTDTMYVENCTHVMAQGMMYKFRNYPITAAFFNHNTFINCSGNVIETLGYQSNMVVTNNIFVNSNVQSYASGLDAGETDADNLPIGIVNTRPLPAEMEQLDRKILVEGNVVYWDSRFDDMPATLNQYAVNGHTDWVPQTITMNTRTQEMFNDNATYPYLSEGVWYHKLPNFTDPKDLLTTQVDALKEWSLGTVDEASTNVMPDWRVVNTTYPDFYVYSDWPIPVDLSYSDADLLVGGTGGFPVGDLNWFPTKKAEWDAQKDAEHAAIENARNTGTTTLSVETVAGPPASFKISQNYPNPFNPSTKITYSLPHSGFVTLKVYNSLGQEVANLVNGFREAQTYDVVFDGAGLTSGVYVYSIEFDNNTISKKMMLLK